VRAGATALTALDVARWRPGVLDELTEARASDTDLPPGYDERAARLLRRATVVASIVALAERDDPAGALTAHEAAARAAALRPIAAAARSGIVAAYSAGPG